MRTFAVAALLRVPCTLPQGARPAVGGLTFSEGKARKQGITVQWDQG